MKLLTLASALALPAATVFGQSQWTNGTSDFNNAAGWSPNGVPTGNASNDSGSTNVVLIQPGDPVWGHGDTLAGQGSGTSGSYLQTGSTNNTGYPSGGSWMRLGIGTGGTFGSYTLSNGVVNVAGQTHLGENGTGVLTVAGGTYNTGYNGNPGFCAGDGDGNSSASVGTLNFYGGTINNVNNETWLGEGAGCSGYFNLSGGTFNANNWFAVGRNGGYGELNISNNAVVVRNGNGNFDVGASGRGVVNQNGGAVTNLSNQTWLGEQSSATWNLNSGIANLGTVVFGVTGNGSGTLNMNGGTLIAQSLSLGNINASAVVNLNGGSIIAAGNNSSFMQGLTQVTIGTGITFDSQAYNITIAQEIDGGGPLTKNGSGTLILTGPNTYSGTTTVNAGKLAINAAQQVNGGYVVANNAELSLTVPSHNAQLNMSSLTLSGATSIVDFDLGAFGNPSAGSAPVKVNGALTVSGVVTVNVADTVPQLGQFALITYTSAVNPSGFVLGSLPQGVGAYLSNNIAGSSLDLVVTNVNLPRWEGQAGGNWDIGLTTNWINIGTGLPTYYTDGNGVLLDDEATGTTAINLTTNINPLSVTFNNTNLTYTVTGKGRINGSTSVFVQGAGTVNMLNTNGYTGATVLSGGILSVTNLANGGVPSAIGASSSNSTSLVLAGGNLSYSGPATTINRGYQTQATNSTLTTVSNLTLTGSATATLAGGLTKSGLGQLTYATVGSNVLSGANSPGYNVADGSVVFDGTAGGQSNYFGGGSLTLNGVNSVATVAVTNAILNTGDLNLGNLGNSTDTLTVHTNSTLNVGGWLIFGDGGNVVSTLNVNHSTLNVLNGKVLMGGRAGDTSTLNINGGILNNAGANGFDIGDGGWNGTGARTGIVNQTGGSNNINTSLSVGNAATGIGFYNLTNGLLNVSGEIDVANGGAVGTFNIVNSTVDAGSWFVTGRAGSTSGILNMLGGVINKTNNGNFLIGSSAGNNGTVSVGVFNISGGVLNCASECWLGENFLDIGTNNISGTAVVNWQNWVSIGRSGLGVVNFSGGTITRTGGGQAIVIGDNVGGPGHGIFNQSGGTLTSSTELWVSTTGSTGEYDLSGGSATITNWIAVGRNSGIGTLNISGGSLTKLGDNTSHLTIGSGGNGTVNQTGGTIINTVSDTFIGESQTGVWNLNAGTAVLGVVRLPLNNNVAGTLNLNGGSITATELSCTNGSGLGTLNFNGGTLVAGNGASANFLYGIATNTVLTGGAIINSGANEISTPQPFLGGAADGGLTKFGSGRLNLNGVSTYTNTTQISAGTLGGSGTLASPVQIASGAGLAAGVSSTIGTLTINNKLTLLPSAATFLKLTPTNSDKIVGLTSVSYNGTLVVSNTSASPLTLGQTFQLFTAGVAGTGNFTSVTVLPAGAGTFNPATGVLTITSSGVPLSFNPVTRSGGNLILTGGGGTPNSSYTVLTTTNLTTPSALWTTNTTGTTDNTGSFSNAIPVSATTPAQFFRVRQP